MTIGQRIDFELDQLRGRLKRARRGHVDFGPFVLVSRRYLSDHSLLMLDLGRKDALDAVAISHGHEGQSA